MANENALHDEEMTLEQDSAQSFNFDELEEKLQQQLEEELADISILQDEGEKINNPDALGEVIQGVVWDQFINQVALVAGDDFIKENHGMKLDLRYESHVQTTENFADGKIASHNTEIDYQQRYDDWQSNFVKDADGNNVKHDTRIPERDSHGNVILDNDGKPQMKQVETLVSKNDTKGVKGYRAPYDEVRQKRGLVGSKEKGTAMDETVSVAEIVRDPAANAHMTQEERIEFDLSDKNLNEIDAKWNASKGDKPTNEWLDNPNSKGQTPQEIFDNMSDEDVQSLREKDAEAREEYERLKKEAEERSVESGKRTRIAEAKKIGGKTVRAVVMTLLAAFVREIISKLVLWLKSNEKDLKLFLSSLKEAVVSFVHKLKNHLMNAADSALTTVARAIWGPVISTIKKVWMMMKQGYAAVKQAVHYLRSPENKGKPKGILFMEVGKILIAGCSAAGAIVLSEVIEKGLIAIPVAGAFFSFEIPLLGSLANILGIFFGAVVAGILGAIIINMIQKKLSDIQREENTAAKIEKGNEILKTQRELQTVHKEKFEYTKAETEKSISKRHSEAAELMSESIQRIAEHCETDSSINDTFDEIDALFSELEEE